MKNINIFLFGKFLSIRVIFALLSIFLVTACGDTEPSNRKRFEYNLQGTWFSSDPTVYDGGLIIDYNKIIILGYEEVQTPPNGNDVRRPFREFTKDVPLSGYAENDTIFIQNAGVWHEIPYRYYTENYGNDRFLRFTFGDRTETLRRSME